ncbi:Shank3 [Columba guinea]|nr:Shank3 [Columba guinea]
MVLKSNPSVILLCSFLPSDYIIEEKTAVLQKREHEGFGFVLRGAKAETPIEEFTPTPAFPALQYLESVDVEGVAWRAGLRTGDFLIEVNGVNVVKVGHKQVVSLIRQGGNHLVMKVVSVSRKPESEEVVRKKGSLNKILQQCDSSSREYEEIQAVEKKWHLHLATPRKFLDKKSKMPSLFLSAPPPPKRAPSTTLTLRSKSMTAELEELASMRRRKGEKLDEILAAAEPALRADIVEADSRAATVKQRPTSRRITPAEISSLFERQGMAAHSGVLAGAEKPHVSLRKGIPRTKSVVAALGVQGAEPEAMSGNSLRWGSSVGTALGCGRHTLCWLLREPEDVTLTRFVLLEPEDVTLTSFVLLEPEDVTLTRFVLLEPEDVTLTRFVLLEPKDVTLTRFVFLEPKDVTLTRCLLVEPKDVTLTRFVLLEPKDVTLTRFVLLEPKDVTLTSFVLLEPKDVTLTRFVLREPEDVTLTRFVLLEPKDVTLTRCLLVEPKDVTLTRFVLLEPKDVTLTRFVLLEPKDVTLTRFVLLEPKDVTLTSFVLLEPKDVTLTRFVLREPEDVTLTRFVLLEPKDVTLTRFVLREPEDVTLTRFVLLEPKDVTLTRFVLLEPEDVTLTRFVLLEPEDVTLTRFVLLEPKDVTLTRFVLLEPEDVTLTSFVLLEPKDVTLTRFVLLEPKDVTLTRFVLLEPEDVTLTRFVLLEPKDVTLTPFVLLEPKDVMLTHFLLLEPEDVMLTRCLLLEPKDVMLTRFVLLEPKDVMLTCCEDEKLAASLLDGKFPRSTSMQDTVREGHGIPPPPQTAPPPPPSPYYFDTGPPPSFSPPPPPGRAYDTIRSSFKPSLEAKLHGLPQVISAAEVYDQARTSIPYPERQKRARSMIILQDSSHLPVEPTEIPRPGPSATPPEKLKRKGRVIDNPYANMGQFNVSLFAPTKPQRKKSPLVKQLQVEDAQERAALSITGGFTREPSPTRRSHRLSGVEYQHHAGIAQVEATSIPFATAIAGVMKDRDRRLDERRKSTVFLSVGAIEGTPPSSDMPSLQQSRSIDERLLGSRDVLLPSPVSALKPLISSSSSTFIHPLTGKPLDPNSPLALALAARERALSTQVPSRSPTPIHSPDSDRAAPLFVDIQTKEPERGELESLVSPAYSPGGKGAIGTDSGTLAPAKSQWGTPSTLRKETEARAETPGKEEKKQEDKKSMIISIVDTSQQKTAGLIMVHATSNGQDEIGLEMKEEQAAVPEACTEPAESPPAEPQPSPVGKPPASPASDKTLGQGSSEEEVEPYTVTLPPAQLSSSDEETREELAKIGLVPPPDEFANGVLVTTPGTPVSHLATPSTPSIPAAAVAPSTTGGTPSGKPSDAPVAPESAADSGVEEVDTRSSSDHHLETTSTISTVSSMSTLSSESGEPTDTYTSFADGQTFILEKPPVPPKPKLKSQLSKGPVTFRDPLLKQSSDSELISQQHAATLASASIGRPRYLFQRRSKLWGDPMESRPIHGADDDKPTVISELSSRLQQLNKDTRSLGEEPAGSTLDPGKKSPVVAARVPELYTLAECPQAPVPFQGLREPPAQASALQTMAGFVAGVSFQPMKCPVKPALDRTEPLSTVRPYGLTPPTILKSSSLSIPHEPKEVRFVVRSVSARSRSPSPSPSPGPPLHTLHPPRPFMQKPLHLWNKYDVGDWLESINLVEHRDKFEDHEIEGTHLPALTKEDFVELGVTRVGHRMNIERALKQLVDS